jgi:hypothetical protein
MRRRTNRNRQLRSILHSPVLLRQLLTPLETAVRQAITEQKEKSWFPQFSILAHLLAGIFFHVQQLRSLRELVARLDIQRKRKRIHGFEIKRTTLSNANNSRRRLRVLRAVFANLVASSSGLPRGWRRLRRIAALDSTLLSCVPSSQWAAYRQNVKACKGHLLFDLERSVPKKLILTAGKIHDYRPFKHFLEVGWTYIVDRAYNAYALFDRMTAQDIYFVTRLKVGSAYHPIAKHRVKRADRKRGVIHDWTVLLGQGRTQMETVVRWVRFRADDGNVYDYIANRFDLSPLTIAQLYEARWAIEKLFKWLKRTLRMERSLGRSAVAYEIHVLMTLIVDILLKILAGLPPRADHISVHVLRIISEHLFVRVTKTLKQTIAEARGAPAC